MNNLLQDIGFAWRNALKRPGTSLLIVLTLALGIGVNGAMFSVAWHVLLAPLPYADGERLVALQQIEERGTRTNYGWSNPTFADFREQNTVFSDLFEYNQLTLTFIGRGDPYHGFAGIVTGSFFEELGVQPVLGRLLTMDDDREGAEPVLLLSHEFWLGKFAGDPAVTGTSLEIQNSLYRIVGVLPPIPGYPHANDVWIPDAIGPYTLAGVGTNPNRNASVISRVIGKLREDVTLEQASRETEVIARRLVSNYPDDYAEDYTIAVTPLKDELTRASSLTIYLLLALALLVVLIASANVANLNLARTLARNQELAIREAVGASPWRVARQLLTESMLLALGGGILGLLLAWPCMNLLAELAARTTPLASEIRMNSTVLLFAFMLILVTGVLGSAVSFFGGRDLNAALKDSGSNATISVGGKHRRHTLLAAQFALAFVMLTISALILLSLWRLQRQDTGFDLEQVLAVNMTLNVDLSEPMQIEQRMRNFSRNALDAISELPGVSAAAIRTGAPLLEQISSTTSFPFEIEGRPAAETTPSATLNMISDDYFTVMNIPLLQGRAFQPEDDGDAVPVAIVNESFVRSFFPDGNALGSNVRLRGFEEWRPVVGVVADVRSRDIDAEEGPVVYISYWQFSIEGVNLYVKTAANPTLLATAIADAVHALDPRQSVLVKPLDDIKSAWLAPTRLRAILIALFGLLALVVTLSGVVGVVSYNVSQRVREIGIHMAIGATPAQIAGLFIAEGMQVYVVGLLSGVVLMLAGAPLLRPLLYQTAAVDPGVYLLSALVLTLAVLGAIVRPAARAGAMSPVAALHCE